MNRKLSMGKTTFQCRNCQTVTVVENADLETMTKFKCSGCGVPMSTVRFAGVKMAFYTKLIQELTQPPFLGRCGPEMFRVNMNFNAHYEYESDKD